MNVPTTDISRRKYRILLYCLSHGKMLSQGYVRTEQDLRYGGMWVQVLSSILLSEVYEPSV